MTISALEITRDQFDNIQKVEAVVLRDYEREDGSRFSKLVKWGDAAEMQIVANTPEILIVPNCVKCLGQQMVMVSDLLPPA